MKWLPALLVLSSATGFAAADELTTNVDFESGTVGWVGPTGPGGGTQIVPTGGNGGGAGFRTIFNNFGITFANDASPAFTGDFTQFDSVTISVDVKVNVVNFGFPVSRPWLVELRSFDLVRGSE